MNKNIKYLIEANIFRDKDIIGGTSVSSKLTRLGNEIANQYKWMGDFIFDNYTNFGGIQEIMQKISAKDTHMIPYGSFNVAEHFGNKLLLTKDNKQSFGYFISIICKIYKGEYINLNWLDMSGVTELTETFKDVENINIDMSAWDVSNVTKMTKTFANSNFHYNVEGWDLSSCISLDKTFEHCQRIEKSIETWQFANLQNMYRTFADIKGDIVDADIAKWNTSTVTSMNQTFTGSVLNYVFSYGINELDVSNVVIFQGCFSETSGYLDLEEWKLNTKKNINCEKMFAGTRIYHANIKDWNVSRISNLTDMFKSSEYRENLSVWLKKLKPKAISTINTFDMVNIFK